MPIAPDPAFNLTLSAVYNLLKIASSVSPITTLSVSLTTFNGNHLNKNQTFRNAAFLQALLHLICNVDEPSPRRDVEPQFFPVRFQFFTFCFSHV